MAISKQVDRIRIGAFIYNGAYRPFHIEDFSTGTYPITLNVWDAEYTAVSDFVGQPTTRALNGFERANPSGFRTDVSLLLNNSYPDDSLKIKQLLDRLGNQYDRTFLTTNVSNVSGNGTTLVLNQGVQSSDPKFDDTYKNLVAINGDDKDKQAVITGYSASDRVATLSESIDVTDSSNVLVVAKANIPTIVGVAVDDTDDLIYCNMQSSSFGIRRELTIGLQAINMELREINRTQFVSGRYRIG